MSLLYSCCAYHVNSPTDLTRVAPEQLRAIVHALNRRPRKCLGFASPFEVFHAQPPG